MTNQEEELNRINKIINGTLMRGEWLSAKIIPCEGQFHILTEGSRTVFDTQELACKWASAYFLIASTKDTAEKIRENYEEDYYKENP